MAERLTSKDMDTISRALDLAKATGVDELRVVTGTQTENPLTVLTDAVGTAQHLLRELVLIVEGLASDRVTGRSDRP